MKSMTGYGVCEFQNDEFQLALEIKSYNNRYLDISFNAPSYLSCYEAEMKERIKTVAARGHIEVNIKLKRFESQVSIVVDESAVRQYAAAFSKVIDAAGLQERPHLTHFLHADDVLKMVRNTDASSYEEVLFRSLDEALLQFAEAKRHDGESTFEDIEHQLEVFEQGLGVVKSHADTLEQRIQENLETRFKQLLGEDYDTGRVLQEVAVMLMKYTINEEIQRIESHLLKFREDMVCTDPVGKRLDFLCQELNREINTVASKSIIVEVNQAVVSMKDRLENTREQLKNIE